MLIKVNAQVAGNRNSLNLFHEQTRRGKAVDDSDHPGDYVFPGLLAAEGLQGREGQLAEVCRPPFQGMHV
jgi:hypothetical protein